MKCYMCAKGELKRTKVPFFMYGLKLGDFDAEACPACNEAYFTEEASKQIDSIAKQKGLWGLESTTKVGQAGNSMDVKISKDIIRFTGLKKGEEVRIYPESKDRLIIERS